MKQFFGLSKRGETASLFVLKNNDGMTIEVTDFGATLKSIWFADKNGNLQDVVLGYDDASSYESPSGTFFGATVGRNANRIKRGAFEINGVKYQLDQNNNGNNLHSGLDYYSYRVWNVKNRSENSITFYILSPDGDQGYPGTVYLETTYRLTDHNSIEIEYFAVTDKDTIINMTNHSYFNLNGHKSGDILDHEMWLNAEFFTETDEESVPTGNILPVKGTPMDFRNSKTVGRDIYEPYEALILGKGYDHNWCLENNGRFEKIAELYSKESGICMEVYTDLPGVQIYTGNYLESEKGKDGAVYQKRQGICFETQHYPDAINHSNFPSCVCKPGDVYRTKTEYKFSRK